jgi:hypothetical protein
VATQLVGSRVVFSSIELVGLVGVFIRGIG